MRFEVDRLDTPDCGVKCPNVVVADGVIEPDTPAAFIDFARSAALSPNLKSVLLINSPGGNVVASMELGAVLRRLKMAAVVASYGYEGSRGGPVAGECVSACVYALMGAVRRIAPPASKVALHRMSVATTEIATRGHTGGITKRFADNRLVDVVAAYARRMGVDPNVVITAESLRADNIRLLSGREMQRWRLATSHF